MKLLECQPVTEKKKLVKPLVHAPYLIGFSETALVYSLIVLAELSQLDYRAKMIIRFKTRMTTSTRFDFKFFRVISINIMLKLLTFDNFFPPLRHSR